MIKSNFLRTFALSVAVMGGFALVSCGGEDEPPIKPKTVTVDFEPTSPTMLAGPTSYGANLYYGYQGTQYKGADFPVTSYASLHVGVNVSEWTHDVDFYGGGIALSTWNYRSNPTDEYAEAWWRSYENQCSVYNIASTDGRNSGAGADNSNTFAIAFGYQDPNSMSNCPEMSFTGDAEFSLYTISLCNTSYVYGSIEYPNPFGSNPSASLSATGGWLKVMFYGYDAQGQPTNGGNPVEFYLADYRTLSPTYTPSVNTWQECSLEKLGKVHSVKINFAGSDMGPYGLCTPAYVAMDNLKVCI